MAESGQQLTSAPASYRDLTIISKGNQKTPFLQLMRTYTDTYFPECDKKSYRIPAIHFNSENLVRSEDYFVRHEQDIAIKKGEMAEKDVIEMLEKMRNESGKGENEPMFLICGFKFENYLNKCKDDDEQTASKRLPVKEGQHDVLLLHLNHGVMFIEIKSIGEYDSSKDGHNKKIAKKHKDKHNGKIKQYVEKALKQLDLDEKIFNGVMEDLNLQLPIRKVLALPNIHKEYLNKLTSTMEVLTQYFGENPLEKCIFKEVVTESKWWETNIIGFPGFPSVDSYKQVIGRYCGLLSVVDVPYSKADVDYRKSKPEIRTRKDAVRELAYRTMKVVLTPTQVKILNDSPSRLKMYGRYGTGKTIMLILKARELVKKREHVVFLNKGNRGPSLLGIYFSACVRAGLDKTLHKYVMVHEDELNLQLIQSRKRINVFIDECKHLEENDKQVFESLPQGCLFWIAHNATENISSDDDWCTVELDVVLRNPQYIKDLLTGKKDVNTVFKVNHTAHRLYGDKPCKSCNDELCGDKPCKSCNDELVKALQELGLFEEIRPMSSECSQLDQAVGAVTGQNLTWSDVVCFLEEKDYNEVKFFPRNNIPHVVPPEFRRRHHEGNAVIVTIPSRFLGLERKVVITTDFKEDALSYKIAISRCTSCLILVNRNVLR